MHAAFAEGRLSYSKTRALTRMATPATEADLVALAAHATAAHLDRIARARRSVSANESDEANARHVHWFWDEDGSLVLTARLAPEEGALVLQALDAAAHVLRNRPVPTLPPKSPAPRRSTSRATRRTRAG